LNGDRHEPVPLSTKQLVTLARPHG
jgi:hypothetical protein